MYSSSEELLTTSDESSLSFDQGDQQDSSIDKQYRIRKDSEDINELQTLQITYNQLESQYLKIIHEFECKFHEQCSYLFEKRSNVINGKYEPSDDECRLKSDFIDVIQRSSEISNQTGIPSFWLQTLKQVPMLAEMIEEWDEPILEYLSDIKFHLQSEPIYGFTLEFHFTQQAKQYFHNEILTKFYELQIEPDNNVLFYEGVAIVRSIGCSIDWINSQVDVTNIHQSSFFQFFTTTNLTDDWKLVQDYQIGHYIRENLIPKAILYYTGEIFDNNDDDDFEFSEEEEEEDDDEQQQQEIGEGEH